MPALLQPNLPRLATEYQDSQSRRVREALTELDALWRRFGNRFDAGWSVIRSAVLAEVEAAQYDLASAAAAFVPAAMEETGQRIKRDGVADPTSLIGVTGSGTDVGSELDWTPVRAKQAMAEGKSAAVAREVARQSLILTATTVLMDTARGGESIGMSASGGGGWIRVVHGGACGRCVVLAGKWFRYNQGFLRHPRCHCTHMPASETLGGHWQTDPRAYFDSLTAPQQIKLMGSKANAQAVLDGADVGQVINVYRRSSGLSVAQSPIKIVRGQKFTTEGTTRRGRAGQQQAGLRRNGPQQIRPTPETIAIRAGSLEERQRLMRLFGYIADDEAAARGRAVFAEARRRERNERRAARAQTRSTNLPPKPAASGANPPGGRPPANPLRSEGMDGDDPREIARQLRSTAREFEPEATTVIRAIADSIGADVKRFATRFKTEASILAKLERFRKKSSPHYRVGQFNDSLRYTLLLEEENYWESVRTAVTELDARYGVKPLELEWRSGLAGLNVTVRPESGIDFEVQFHTDASLQAAKETREQYERWRALNPASKEARELRAEIDAVMDAVPRPPTEVP